MNENRKISLSEAIALARKWEKDSSLIKGIFELLPEMSGLFKFAGSVAVTGFDDSITITSGSSSMRVAITFPDLILEYSEHPDDESIGTLTIEKPGAWRCVFSEFKSILSAL